MMRSGCTGEDVRSWQDFLRGQGFSSADGTTLVADGVFGASTKFATAVFQGREGLAADGVVGGRTLQAASKYGFCLQGPAADVGGYPFLPAKNFTSASRTRIDLIVIHTMEAPQTSGRALQVAKWFSSSDAPQASAHFCVDDTKVIRCVHDKDVAWHAPGANSQGIGIEHAGYASSSDWNCSYSQSMMLLSTKLVSQLCSAYGIPAKWLSAEDLRQGARGICGHYDCTMAFSAGRGHTDPGPNFPKDAYVALVVKALSGSA